MSQRESSLINAIAQKIYDKKGFNIIALDVREVTSLTDYFIIAEGSVERHVQALSKEVLETIKEWKLTSYHVEGDKTGDWIVIDCAEVIVHLFVPDLREKYRLEELWHDGKIINLDIVLETDRKKQG